MNETPRSAAMPVAPAGSRPAQAPSALRVQAALDAAGLDARVIELASSARSAREAAASLGVEVGQIVKSLVFRGRESGRAVLAIVAGDHRVSEPTLARLCGEPIARADAAFVREATGYAIGGVPPLGHATPIAVYADESLARYDVVWAAGGTPVAVFAVAPGRLFAALGVVPVDLRD